MTVAKPALFTQTLAGLIGPSGEAGIDRLIWGPGASVWHPDPPVQWFWNSFEFLEDMVEGLALPQVDKAAKRKILGVNYARLIGLDIEAAKQRISNDEFAQRRAEDKAAPYSTTRSAGVAV